MYTSETGNDGIIYVAFHPSRHPHLLPQLVECYRQVFAAGPWNEWKRCPACGHHWGVDSETELQAIGYRHCGVAVVDYWPSEQVAESIVRQITQDASCWLAMTKDRGVIGFTWGYPISPEDLATKLEKPDLAEVITQKFGKRQLVSYQAEIGLLIEFRDRRIATQLASLRLRDMKRRGMKVGVVRTMMDPPSKTYLWFTRDGYEVISHYHDSGKRVIMARSYEGFEHSPGAAAKMSLSGPV